MCLAIPYKITKINGQKVEAISADQKKIRLVNLLEKVKVGDLVISQNNLIIKILK